MRFVIKFIYAEKTTKFCEIFPLLLIVCTAVKNKGKISQNFVAFSEHMNFSHVTAKSVSREIFVRFIQYDSSFRLSFLIHSKTIRFKNLINWEYTFFDYWLQGYFCCCPFPTHLGYTDNLPLDMTNHVLIDINKQKIWRKSLAVPFPFLEFIHNMFIR